MLTLTSRPGASWEGFMKEWSHLVRFLRRTSPDLTYAASKEEGGNSGMLHLHVVLVNFQFTPQRAISAEWFRLTGARVVDIRRLQGTKAAAYVAKYVSKDECAAKKLVTFGKGWPKLPSQELHLVPLESVGSWGPSVVRELTADGGIVEHVAAECGCWGAIRPAELRDHLWLKSIMDRLWGQLAAASGP